MAIQTRKPAKKKIPLGNKKIKKSPNRSRVFGRTASTKGLMQLGTSRLKVGTSKTEGEWLNKLNVVSRQIVFHGFNGKTFVVDGLNPNTRTVYEYLGDFWHGNISRMKAEAVNPLTKKTNKQMYLETKGRFQYLHELGYKVFFVWESDYKRGKMGRYYTGKADTLF